MLFKQEHVLNVQEGFDNTYIGQVRSASDDGLDYQLDIEVTNKGVLTYCSCPVHQNCKHGAAMCYQIIEGDDYQADDNSVVEEWLNSFEPEKKQNQKKGFVYLLDSTNSKRISVHIHTATIKKNGDWGKSLCREYFGRELCLKKHASELDKAIISSLIKNAESAYSSACTTQESLDLLISSERCFWEPYYDLQNPIKRGKDIISQWYWQRLTDDLCKLALKLDDDFSDVHLFSTQSLSYFNSELNCMGLIETDVEPRIASKLLNCPTLSIGQIPWVENKFNLNLGEQASSIPKASFVQNKELNKPVPQLLLETGSYQSSWNKEEPSSTICLRFAYQDLIINPNNDKQSFEVNGTTLYRDSAYEKDVMAQLRNLGFLDLEIEPQYGQLLSEIPCVLETPSRSRWYHFIHQHIKNLKKQGWLITFDKDFYYQQVQTNGELTAKVKDEPKGRMDYFEIGIDLNINGQTVPAFPLMLNALKQVPKSILLGEEKQSVDEDATVFVDLEKGQFVALKFSSIKPFLKQFVELLMPGALNEDGLLKLPRLQSHQTLALLDDQGIITQGASKLRQLANKLRNFDGIKNIGLASNFKAQLRPYQQQGVNWLQFLREYQLAGILADDMGLGKTVQTLAHLAIEKEQGRLDKPCLIIAPTSVIYNWQNEISKFTPELSCIVMHGPQRKRHFTNIDNYDIVITSYALINKDENIYQQHDLYYLILDEAQYIKNPKTKLYESITQIKPQHKLCLTGTPMENHLGELWSQFNFLLPGFLGGHSQFTQLFKSPIQNHGDQQRKQVLNQRIKPFILRRTKENIAQELPKKTEIIQRVRVDTKQAELYESVRLTMDNRLKSVFKNKGLERSQIEVLDALLKLRQVCCHPQLVAFDGAKKVKHSAKLELLMDMLPELIAEGRKILVFSQFTSMLELIEDELQKQHIAYLQLTGKSTKRQAIVDRFQQGDIPVFLISLKAGGVGLNLTAADTVIHFDPWWNPAVENQATDRAHRIGQDKPVFVYKLIVENSIEEKIQVLQKEKAALANDLLSEEISDGKLSLTDDVVASLLAPLKPDSNTGT